MRIINSLLENDLYKFSMAQFILHRFPTTEVKVEFRCRSGKKVGYLRNFVDAQLDELCKLRFTNGEIAYLRTIPWLSSDFVDYLRRFYMFRDQIHTDVDSDEQLVMWAEGPWRDVIWFEVPCLAIVEQLYMGSELGTFPGRGERNITDACLLLESKISYLNNLYEKHPFTLSEFGLRRRCSSDWEDLVVDKLRKHPWFSGTSNVFLAKKHGVKPSGTMAHEIFMGLQGVGIQLRNVQRETWRLWMEEFRGRNGIMLTDPFGARACFNDLDWYVANSFSGFRHDSGDPIVWGEELIKRLEQLRIDPKTKTFVWSDCLNIPTIERIAELFSGRVKVAFGVGTNLVNDIPGIPPLSIVMKMTYANGQPVLKLSDDQGKGMCPDPSLVEYCKKVYQYDPIRKENNQ